MLHLQNWVSSIHSDSVNKRFNCNTANNTEGFLSAARNGTTTFWSNQYFWTN